MRGAKLSFVVNESLYERCYVYNIFTIFLQQIMGA